MTMMLVQAALRRHLEGDFRMELVVDQLDLAEIEGLEDACDVGRRLERLDVAQVQLGLREVLARQHFLHARDVLDVDVRVRDEVREGPGFQTRQAGHDFQVQRANRDVVGQRRVEGPLPQREVQRVRRRVYRELVGNVTGAQAAQVMLVRTPSRQDDAAVGRIGHQRVQRGFQLVDTATQDPDVACRIVRQQLVALREHSVRLLFRGGFAPVAPVGPVQVAEAAQVVLALAVRIGQPGFRLVGVDGPDLAADVTELLGAGKALEEAFDLTLRHFEEQLFGGVGREAILHVEGQLVARNEEHFLAGALVELARAVVEDVLQHVVKLLHRVFLHQAQPAQGLAAVLRQRSVVAGNRRKRSVAGFHGWVPVGIRAMLPQTV